MKKAISIAVLLALAVSCFVGCSSGDKASESATDATSSVEVTTTTTETTEATTTTTTEATTTETTISRMVTVNSKELDELIAKQPVYVKSTKYVVQDKRYKTLYPDLLQAVIMNNSKDDIKNAVVVFVAWDENNLPVKIKGEYDFSDDRFCAKCGFKVESTVMKTCKECGKKLAEDAMFCSGCGAKLELPCANVSVGETNVAQTAESTPAPQVQNQVKTEAENAPQASTSVVNAAVQTSGIKSSNKYIV